MIFNPRTTQRVNEKTEEYRKRQIALKDSKADKNLIELANDILEDLQNLNESYLILDSRQRDIMKLLDRDEVYFLTELLNTFAEHKEDETAGYVSFKYIKNTERKERDFPAVKFLTEFSSGPELAVFAFRKHCFLKQKLRSVLQIPGTT